MSCMHCKEVSHCIKMPSRNLPSSPHDADEAPLEAPNRCKSCATETRKTTMQAKLPRVANLLDKVLGTPQHWLAKSSQRRVEMVALCYCCSGCFLAQDSATWCSFFGHCVKLADKLAAKWRNNSSTREANGMLTCQGTGCQGRCFKA